jgi:hypothetical protein
MVCSHFSWSQGSANTRQCYELCRCFGLEFREVMTCPSVAMGCGITHLVQEPIGPVPWRPLQLINYILGPSYPPRVRVFARSCRDAPLTPFDENGSELNWPFHHFFGCCVYSRNITTWAALLLQDHNSSLQPVNACLLCWESNSKSKCLPPPGELFCVRYGTTNVKEFSGSVVGQLIEIQTKDLKNSKSGEHYRYTDFLINTKPIFEWRNWGYGEILQPWRWKHYVPPKR